MRVLLFGHPLGHSLSPAFQNAAFAAVGLPHRYELMPFERFERDHVRVLLDDPSVLGANVTLPYKQDIMGVVDSLSPDAQRVGAVNTVYREKGQLIGHNTDVGGFLADLSRTSGRGYFPEALVLGAGGAARAVVAGLLGLGGRVFVWNRTASRAEELARSLGAAATECLSVIEAVDLVVDATAIGVADAAEVAPWPVERAGPDTFFYDLKYRRETPLLSAARSSGRPHADGLGMLIQQGALAFEKWTGQTAPVDAMWDAVRRSR